MRLIIVGSGIVGAACAYTASSLGAQVTLVDAAWPGRATAAGAGIICPWTAAVDDPAWYGFARAAARQYPALIADLEERGEADVSYARVGALLAGDHDQLEQARQRLTARRAAAPEMGEVALLDDRQARELFPPLRAGAAALFIPGAARVDGRRLAAALTRAATRLGATTRTGEAKLAYRVSRVTGVTVDGELIEATRLSCGPRVDGAPARAAATRRLARLYYMDPDDLAGAAALRWTDASRSCRACLRAFSQAADSAETAVEALYTEHAVSVIRLAYLMLGDRPAAEDVVQDAVSRESAASWILVDGPPRETATAGRYRRGGRYGPGAAMIGSDG